MDTVGSGDNVPNGDATAVTRSLKDIVKERFKDDETIEFVSNHKLNRCRSYS